LFFFPFRQRNIIEEIYTQISYKVLAYAISDSTAFDKLSCLFNIFYAVDLHKVSKSVSALSVETYIVPELDSFLSG
tara:strand:- start:264 stop:491 length:228 start_codon:yes stop_codon:yes gene_type:complete